MPTLKKRFSLFRIWEKQKNEVGLQVEGSPSTHGNRTVLKKKGQFKEEDKFQAAERPPKENNEEQQRHETIGEASVVSMEAWRQQVAQATWLEIDNALVGNLQQAAQRYAAQQKARKQRDHELEPRKAARCNAFDQVWYALNNERRAFYGEWPAFHEDCLEQPQQTTPYTMFESQPRSQQELPPEYTFRKRLVSSGSDETIRATAASYRFVESSSAGPSGWPVDTALPHRSSGPRIHSPHSAAGRFDEADQLSDSWSFIPRFADRACVVCADTKAPLDFASKPPTTACRHKPQTCFDCLANWMASEVDTKGFEGITCPECPQTLTYNDVQRAASPGTFAIYDRLTIRGALGSLPNFAWCLSPTCDAGQENVPDANFMECLACGYRQCLSHRIPWHEEETCDGYDYRISGQQARDEEKQRRDKEQQKREIKKQKRDKEQSRREQETRKRESEQRQRQQEKRMEETKTRAMLDDVSKKCPNPEGCGWRIQKSDGCDHMTCRPCRWESCWSCLASQDSVSRYGNKMHERSCPHYA